MMRAAVLLVVLAGPALAQQDATALHTVTPREAEVPRFLVATGRAEAQAQVDLVARVPGVLRMANVADGAVVTEGQPLFLIEPEPYEADRDAARAAVIGAEAQLAYSETEFLRQRELSERQVNARAELDAAEATRDSARADLEAARAQLRMAEITLGYTRITAPFDGVMSARTADPGAYVGANGAEVLATLVSTGPAEVAFSISEADLPGLLALQQAGPVMVEVGPVDGADYPLTAVLDYLAPSLSADLGTLALRAQLEGGRVIHGATLRIRMPLGAPEPRLLLPPAAIGTDLEGRHVFTIEDGRVARHAVTLEGGPVDGLVPVTGDIAADAQVIANIAAAPSAGSPARAQ